MSIAAYKKALGIEKKLYSNKAVREFLSYDSIFLGEFIRHNLAIAIAGKHVSDMKFNLLWSAMKTRDKLGRVLRSEKIRRKKADVIIFVNAISHVTTIAPLIKELKKQKTRFLVIANGNGAQSKARDLKISYNAFEEYFGLARERFEQEKKIFLFKFRAIEKTKEVRSIKNKFLALVLRTVAEMETLKYIIEKEKPRLFIVLNELEMFGRTIVGIAKSKRIKTLYLQHGAIAEHPSYVKLYANKMAAWGNEAKKIMIGLGSKASDITVTGNPSYDQLISWKVDRDYIYKKLGLDTRKGVVVLATQPAGFEVSKENNIKVAKSVIKAVESFPNKQLLLKLHPDEYGFLYAKIIKGMKAKNVRICKHHLVNYKINIFDVLSICDLLITQFSTTAMEAMIKNKPVVTINLTGKPDMMAYAKSKAAIGVYKTKDIAPAIKKALYNKKTQNNLSRNRKRFVYQNCYKLDGNATKRVVGLVKGMVRR